MTLILTSNVCSKNCSDGTENLVYVLRNGRATDATADEQLTMLAARGSTEAATFAEHDRSMAERDEQAWKQTRPPRLTHFPATCMILNVAVAAFSTSVPLMCGAHAWCTVLSYGTDMTAVCWLQ